MAAPTVIAKRKRNTLPMHAMSRPLAASVSYAQFFSSLLDDDMRKFVCHRRADTSRVVAELLVDSDSMAIDPARCAAKISNSHGATGQLCLASRLVAQNQPVQFLLGPRRKLCQNGFGLKAQ